MRRVLGALLVVALLAGPGVSAATVTAQQSPDRTSLTMTVSVQPDGDARWHVTTRFLLDDEDDREAFRELGREFEDGDADVDFSADAFRRAAAAASDAAGREMNVTAVQRNATINDSGNRTVGVIRLSFRWTNFAHIEGNEIVVDDAFNTSDGTWLPTLTDDQRLVIEPPTGYGVDDAPLSTNPDSLSESVITWVGPQSFKAGDLHITYTRGARPRTPTVTPTQTPDLPVGNRSVMLALGLGGLGVGVVVLAAYLRRREGATGPDDGEAPTGGPAAGDGDAAATPVGGDDDPASEEEADADEAVDPDLLSDEERVLHLLERNGGRMKQANIVSETGWSNAKVSQLLSSMADDGEVEKLRIGRENLISLPDEDVTDIDEE
jgi:hypothetical protein